MSCGLSFMLIKSIGCLWALGITSVSTILYGLLSDMAIKRASRLFGNWSMLVYSRLIFEHVTSVALDLFRPLSHFAVAGRNVLCSNLLLTYPKFVVDIKRLARMSKFQIESISEIALSDRVVKVECRISGIHSTVMQHILDVEVEMAYLRKSFPSVNNIEVAPPSSTTTSAQDYPRSPKSFWDDSVSGAANVRESQPGNNDPVPTLDLHRLDQSMQASSGDMSRPIDTSTTVLDSTVITTLNVHGVETLIGDDGKTYDLPLKVNLNQSRSCDKNGVVINFYDASVQIQFIVKSYGDALKTRVRHRTQSHVVFGNSNRCTGSYIPCIRFWC